MRFLSQPQGYFRLFHSVVLERFVYHGFKALFFFYLLEVLFFSKDEASQAYGLFFGFASFLPVVGGFIIDTVLRGRKPLVWASVSLIFGFLLIAIAGFASLKFLFWGGAFFFLLGESLFKPGIYSRLIQLYSDRNSPSVSAGFVFLVLAPNLGGFFAPLILASLGRSLGYGVALLVAVFVLVPVYFFARQVSLIKSNVVFNDHTHGFALKWLSFVLFVVVVPYFIITEFKDRVLDLLPGIEQLGTSLQITDVVCTVAAAIAIPFLLLHFFSSGRHHLLRISEKWSHFRAWGLGLFFLLSTAGLVFVVGLIGTVGFFASRNTTVTGTALVPLVLILTGILAVADLVISPIALEWVAKWAPERFRATYLGGWMTLASVFSASMVRFPARADGAVLVWVPLFIALLASGVFMWVKKTKGLPVETE